MSKLFTYATSALFLTAVATVVTVGSSKTWAASNCSQLFETSSLKNPISIKYEPMSVEAEGVVVTGDRIKVILDALDLSNQTLQQLKENKSSVLSLGEGFSELLPELVERGIDVKGLDLWYHSDNINGETHILRHMKDYQNLYASHLIRGSALNIPLKAESVNFVLSHRLVSHLHIAQQLRVITETIRILKVSGEARLLVGDSRKPNKSEELIFSTLLKFINENYAATVQAEINSGLLILKKTGPIEMFDQVVIPFDERQFYENLPKGTRATHEQKEDYLIKSYQNAIAALKRHPDDFHLAQDVKILEGQVNSTKKKDLTERVGFDHWWSIFKSRLSIKPIIKH